MLRMMVYIVRSRKRVYLPNRDYTGTGNHRPANPTHAVLEIPSVLLNLLRRRRRECERRWKWCANGRTYSATESAIRGRSVTKKCNRMIDVRLGNAKTTDYDVGNCRTIADDVREV